MEVREKDGKSRLAGRKFKYKRAAKRLLAFMLAAALVIRMFPGMRGVVLAEDSNDTGNWVINSDGTLGLNADAASNAVRGVNSNISLVLIGTNGGTITLPDSITSNSEITHKISDAQDAALILFQNDKKVDKSVISNILTQVKFSGSTSSVNIAVSDGDTSINVTSDDTTFGILNASGEAHIYKYVNTTLSSWIEAYHLAVTGAGTLGGFKGYLATVTSETELTLLNGFYNKVKENEQGGWVAATSMKYTSDKTIGNISQVPTGSEITPNNYEMISTFSQSEITNGYRIPGTYGAYYWSNTKSGYANEFYWADGPEAGNIVDQSLWKSGEPNNSGGECVTVASYNDDTHFNDFKPNNTNVKGYFLEFSAYENGLIDGVTYKSTTIYKVTYDGNGASSGTVPSIQAKFKNQAMTLAVNSGNLVRNDGKGFNGWNTKANGSGTHYDAGGTLPESINENITLYAQWVDNPAKEPNVTGPSNKTLSYGYTSGSISITASPDEGATYKDPLEYQWYFSKTGSTTDGQLISGATESTYDIPTGSNGYDIGSYYFYCKVTAERTDNGYKASKLSDVATVTVVKAPAKISYQTTSVGKVYGNGNFTNELTNTGDGAVSYVSSNTDVATVDDNGEVTIVGAGEAEITATAEDGIRYFYESDDDDNTASYTLTVDRAAIIPVVSMADYTYGTENVPAPEISGNSGNGAVTYYYNTTDSNTGGTEWTGINGNTLSAGTYYMYAVVAETANHKAATSAPVPFKVTQAANEVTAVNIEDWTYGDPAKQPSVTADFGADTVRYTYYTDELCTEMTKAADGAASEGGVPSYAGPYWIKAEIPATGNYASAEGTKSFTINKKAVTITAKPQTINYGEQITNNISEAETSSLAAGDSLASISLTASTENATTAGKVTPSEATIKKGETDVTGCYEITYADGNLTINKVDPTVTPPEAKDLTYNGVSQELISAGSTEHGTLSYAVTTTDSAPQDDEFTYNNDKLPEELNAGTYYVWYKVTGDDNHNNTAALSVPVTIKKRDISNAEVILTDELTYNGSEQTQDVAGVLITGEGSNLQLDAKDSCTFTGNKKTDAGTYTMTVTAGEDTNYTGSCTKDYTIGRKAVTLTSGSAEREYDGTPLTNSTVEAVGFVEGQGASYNVTGSQTDAGDSENVFTYTFNGGTKDTNYEVKMVKGTLKVTQAQSNAVTVKIEGWEYGQTPNDPEVENVTFGADTVQYTYGASKDGEFTETVPVTVGTWYVKANIPETANYVGASNIAEFEITQKSLKITADDAEKVYDGTELTCNTYTNSELAEGDSFESVTVTGSRTWVGESENISSEAIIVNTNGDNVTYCYKIEYVSGTLKVTKKAVKITADDAKKIYDGTKLTCDTYTNSELAEGDSIVSVAVTGSQTDVGSSDNIPGDAVITNPNGEIVTDNYDIQYVNGKLEVTKKAVTVTTDDGSKIFGEKDPEFTFKTDGLVGEEALEGITLSREAGEDAGEYIISAESSEEKNTNYDITFDNKGKLTIAAKDVTPSVDKIEDKYYTGKEISPEMVVKDGEDIIPASEYTVKYKDNVETGKATAVISDVKGGNYNIAETTVNFNILPRGEVEVTEPAEENDCKGKLDEEETAVISKVELSADDQSALDTGKNVSIFLEIKTINDTVSAEDKAVVEETAKNNKTGSELTVGWYLDLSLFKQIFGEDKVKITETNGALDITIEIPESLRKDGRTFYVIRVHDGDGEIIPSKQEGNFIRFTTDRFSTYALAYVDKTDANDASAKPADVKPADGSSAKSEDGLSEVKTGDNTNVLLIFLLMIDSGLAAVYFALQKKGKERRNR